MATIMLSAAVYFGLNSHLWFFDLLGQERDPKFNRWFFIGLFLVVAIYRLPPRKAARSWAATSLGARFFAALALFVCLGGLSTGLNEQPDAVRGWLTYLYAPIGVLVCVFVLHPTDRTIRQTLAAFLVMAVACSVVSTVLHVRLWSGENLSYIFYPSSPTFPISYLVRSGVPGMGSNMLPSMLVPLVLTGLYFIQTGTGWIRLMAAGTTAFLFFNMLIMGSKGALVSLAAGLLYLAWRRWFRFDVRLVLAGALLAAVFAVSGDFAMSRFQTSVRQVRNQVGDYEDRAVASLDSLSSYFARHPIVGAGFTRHRTEQNATIGGDSNIYTQFLAQGGLFLFVPFGLVLVVIHRNAARTLRECRGDREAVDLGSILVAGFIAFVVDMNFPAGMNNYYAVWWGLVVAWTRNAQFRRLAAPVGTLRTRPVPLRGIPLKPIAAGGH